MSSRNDGRPLSGVRVVDWTHVLSGPFAGYQLALLGAEVIRIEQPSSDDLIRSSAADPELARLGLGETFVGQGAGKRSLALDIKQPAAKAALRRLIAEADVVLENFRPGKLASLGFDPAELIRLHPRLIVCSITGFGPESDRRAYDHVVQAASGLMAANATADGTPRRIGFPLVDYAVGQQAALAVMTALYRRDAAHAAQREQGEWLQVTMQDAALTLMTPAFIETLVSGRARQRSASTAFSGNPMSGTFEVADGWLAIVCNAPEQTQGLIVALRDLVGAEHALVAAVEAGAMAGDVEGTQAALRPLLRMLGAAEWEARLGQCGVPAATVRSPVDAARAASDRWPSVPLPSTRTSAAREVRVPGIGFSSNLPLTSSTLDPAPRRGADTRTVLRDAGLTDRDIDQLIAARAAGEPQPPSE